MKTIKEAQKKSEQESAVDNYLQSIGVKFAVYPAGANLNRDGWTCDGWRVEFATGKAREQFDYYTGTGHRVITAKGPYDRLSWELKKLNPRCIAAEHVRARMAEYVRPFAPFAASVLYCLVSDAKGCQQNCKDWCADYGYDSDSIKALNTYNACCDTADRLRRVFTREQIEKLSELLQDY